MPTRLESAAHSLLGTSLGDAEIADVVAQATAALEIMTDPHGSPEFRRRAARTLAVRALVEAREEARGQAGGST
jgi:CO/xanthine dehydrogenase FAD-binding subunit